MINKYTIKKTKIGKPKFIVLSRLIAKLPWHGYNLLTYNAINIGYASERQHFYCTSKFKEIMHINLKLKLIWNEHFQADDHISKSTLLHIYCAR